MSRRIALVELVPYHSIAFDSGGLIRELPSARAAVRFVKNDLLERAADGRALIIAVRRVKDWGIGDRNLNGVVAYTGRPNSRIQLEFPNAGWGSNSQVSRHRRPPARLADRFPAPDGLSGGCDA
jgi:hypothetical protein